MNLIYGKNPCLELIKQRNNNIINCYVTSNNIELIDLLKKNNIKFRIQDKQYLDSLVKTNSQGIVIETKEFEYASLESLITDNSLIVVLDGISDPHNLGAIIRTCEVSGVSGIIIPKNRSALVNQTVYKTSAGAVNNVLVCLETNLTQTLKKLKKLGYWVYGAALSEEAVNYWDTDYHQKTVLVIGSEGSGISRLVLNECDFQVKIPMWGQINSLNASVSCAIIIYEIRRQQK